MGSSKMTDDQIKMNAATAQVLKQVEVNLINQTKINNDFAQVLKRIQLKKVRMNNETRSPK
jgi:hypothetical protein